MNLTPEHIGMLKGATATALLFIAGIAISCTENTKKKWTS